MIRILTPRVALVVVAVLAIAAVAVAEGLRPAPLSVTTTKASRTVEAGAAARFALRIDRPRRFGGSVHLSVSGGPAGATVTWRRQAREIAPVLRHWHFRTRMLVQTPQATAPGTYALTIVARNGARRAEHRVEVVVVAPGHVGVSGDLGTPLAPGLRQPLDLVLTNDSPRPVSLTALHVLIDPRTSHLDCSGDENFRVTDVSRLPLTVPPGTMRLSDALPSSEWPQVEMLDLPRPQDACKGTRLTLHYATNARG